MNLYIKTLLIDVYVWIRWGDVTIRPTAYDGGWVSEYEVIGRFGRIIGYYAYGSFDPYYPYRGQFSI